MGPTGTLLRRIWWIFKCETASTVGPAVCWVIIVAGGVHVIPVNRSDSCQSLFPICGSCAPLACHELAGEPFMQVRLEGQEREPSQWLREVSRVYQAPDPKLA
jgi:hypothetical protein